MTLFAKKPPTYGTLNTKVRKDEMNRIWYENQKLLTKINSIKTHYPAKTLNKNASMQEYLKNIISYNSSKPLRWHNRVFIDRFERNNYFLKINKSSSILN